MRHSIFTAFVSSFVARRSICNVALAAAALLIVAPAALAGNYSPGGLGTADLEYWLDANHGVETSAGVNASSGQTVEFWRDRSGTNDAQQAALARQPTFGTTGPNGSAILNFPGTGSSADPKTWMRTAVSNTSNNFSVFGVAQRSGTHQIDSQSLTGTGGTAGQYYLFGPTNRSADGGTGLSMGTNGISVYEHGAGYMPSLATWNAGTNGVGSSYNIVAYEYTNRQPAIYMNGTLRHTGLTSTRNGAGGSSYAPYEIGGNSNYGGLNGNMTEALLYTRTLNVTEKNIVNNYLSSKYNLPLAGGTDRYAGDTTLNGNYDWDVFGVGRTSGTDLVLQAGAGGLNFKNAALDDGEWLFAGHATPVSGLTEVAPSLFRWDRAWYIDNNNGTIDVDLEFNFEHADLVPAFNTGDVIQLLYADDLSLDWQVLSQYEHTAGDPIVFSTENILNGYYTLQIMSVPEPGSATLLLCGLVIATRLRRRTRRALA